jgi:hypothetical protein
MGLHQERHPTPIDGCGPCRWSSVRLAAQAIPTRRPDVVTGERKDRQMDVDRTEYRTLRRQGYQPPQVRGSAARARTASSAADIETPHPSKSIGRALR